MKVDEKTVKKIASLARIEVKQDELAGLQKDLSNICGFIEQLSSLKISSDDFTSSENPQLTLHKDEVKDGGYAEDLLANTENKFLNCFVVPRVVDAE